MKIENLIVYFSDVRVYNRNQKMLDKREEKEHENRLSGNLWKIGKTKWCDPSAGEGRYGAGNPARRMKTQRMNKLNGSKNRSLVRDKSRHRRKWWTSSRSAAPKMKIKPSSLAEIKKVGAFGTHLFTLGNNCKFFWLTFLFFQLLVNSGKHFFFVIR